jgi:hypothetical protein
MKNQNMRDMQKRWAEQRRKAEEKAAKVAPRTTEPAAQGTAAPKNEEPAPAPNSALAKKKKAAKSL